MKMGCFFEEGVSSCLFLTLYCFVVLKTVPKVFVLGWCRSVVVLQEYLKVVVLYQYLKVVVVLHQCPNMMSQIETGCGAERVP